MDDSAHSAEPRTQAEWVHWIAHELRTPITVISGFARLLGHPEHGELSEKQQRFVSEVLRACGRIDAFVEDLLEGGLALSGALSIDRKPAAFADTLHGVLESLAPRLGERQLNVECQLDPALGVREFDAGRIEQVLNNLMSNAIRYGRTGGTIRVSARVLAPDDGGADLRVAVEDDGPGIPEADRVRVLEPYVRGEGGEENEARSGLGIGLAICRRIVEGHGGALRVGMSDLGGARIEFDLEAKAVAGGVPTQ